MSWVIFLSFYLYVTASSLLVNKGWLPPVNSMYRIIPVDHKSTLFEYSLLKATSGAIKIKVPQCWSKVAKDECSYLALRPKSASLMLEKSLLSPTKMLSKIFRFQIYLASSLDALCLWSGYIKLPKGYISWYLKLLHPWTLYFKISFSLSILSANLPASTPFQGKSYLLFL